MDLFQKELLKKIMNFEKYIAHRGLHAIELWAPENSCEAFRRAVDKGFAIELDIQLTKDNQIAVFHDESLYRMTGVHKNISEMTMSELSLLRLQDTSEKIPSLSDVLKIVNGKVPLLIEIKSTFKNFGRIEKILAKQMRSYKGKWVVQSFNPFSLYQFSKIMPKVPRGQLITKFKGPDKLTNFFRNILVKPFFWKRFSKPKFLSYDLKYISMDILILAVENNCDLFTWTASTPELLTEAEKFSDSIIFEGFIPEN